MKKLIRMTMKNNTNMVMPEMLAANPIIIDQDKCIGCNKCVNICQVDVLIPNIKKKKPPVVLYPGECWYCGCCVMECPVEGAIKLRHPLMNRARWIAKEELLGGDR
jgi:NAD-dependent dihydropyrimidine dehydrogenase PreA subunit